MKRSLGHRILAWSAAGTIATVMVILLLVDTTFRATVRDDVRTQLAATTQLTSELHASRFRDLVGSAASLAMNPVLRGSVETADPATIRATLNELRGLTAADWLAVLSPDGSVTASIGMPPADLTHRVQSILAQVPYYDTGDVWRSDGALIEVVASMIYFGDRPLAVLVAGHDIDHESADVLEKATLQAVAYIADGAVIAVSGGLPAEARRALDAAIPAGTGGDDVTADAEDATTPHNAPRTLDLAGEPFLIAGAPLRDAGGLVIGEVINLRSLHAAQAPVRKLRASILIVAIVGLLLAAISSWLLSRSVTGPLGRLLGDANRMGAGDLDAPVVPAGNDEIGALSRGFESMRTSLRDARSELIRNERLSAIGRAAGAIVHDFAQPITVLMGHAQLLDGEEDAEARHESITTMRGELERLRGMMNEILEFTRGEKQLVCLPVTVGQMIDGIVRGLSPGLAERNVRLTAVHGYDGEWELDGQRMERVLHNLVGNAAGAIGSDGAITIRTTLVGDALRISITDDGPGIPAAVRDTLFEPFVTSGKKGGTGLGLAIVKNIIERHKGTIHVASSQSGTTFVIEIPQAVTSFESLEVESPSRRPLPTMAASIAFLAALAAAPAAQAQTAFYGQVDLVAKSEPDALGINRTLRGSVYNEFRIRGFARSWFTDRIGFFGEVMFDGRYGTPLIVGAYFVANELGGHEWLNTRLGLAPSLIGNFGQRSTYFNANPLIGVPLAWSYLSVLEGTGLETVERLEERRMTHQRSMPMLYDACWNMQWELLGELDVFEYSIGVTPAAMSNPRASGHDGVQLLARIGAEPTPGVRVGASAGIGPYIGVTPTSTAPVVDNPKDYNQRLAGVDFEYGLGALRVFAEAYATSWEMPLIDSDLSLWSGYVEGRYTVSPGWYLAGRFDQMTFAEGESAGQTFRWDDSLWRSEVAVGYRPTREVLVKLDWQHTRFTTGSRNTQNILALQLSAMF